MGETFPCNPGSGEATPKECLPAKPVDCEVDDWSAWGDCSKSCGGGTQSRSREITVYPSDLGKPCEGTLGEAQGCNRAPCEATCTPVDCTLGDWGEWSACDKCGGQQKRFRHVILEAQCGGTPCKPLAAEETTNCTRKCHEPVYCMWGDWTQWGACSATCGSGEKSRTRHLTLTSDPTIRVLGDASELDEAFLEDRFQQLQQQSKGMQTRRLQGLILAFTGGGITLVAGLAVLRAFSRIHGRDHRFSRLTEEGIQIN